MTLVIAVGCSDGVILAADSAMTDSEIGSQQMAEKISQIRNLPMLMGFSGSVGLLQKVEEDLQTFQQKTTPKRIRQHVKELVLPELALSTKWHAPYPQQGFHQPPVCILLLAGVLNGEPWILEIERDGSDQMFGPKMGSFAAIGSGKNWAQAIMRPHLMTERTLEQGKVFAYRVLEDSINLGSELAKPIHMLTVSADGTVATVDQDEQDQTLAPTCELWRSLERDAVGKLFAPQMAKEPTPEIPDPEASSGASQPSPPLEPPTAS
jgi:20S proteasome alpha/beta subunit